LTILAWLLHNIVILGAALTATATSPSLLLKFGPTGITTTAGETNSPAHATGAVPLSQVTWNSPIITNSAQAFSGGVLYYSDGSTASGVSFLLGRSPGGASSNVVTFPGSGYVNNNLGSAQSTGIYTSGYPPRGAVYGGSGSINAYAVGLRVDGLPAGPYTVYCTGRNSNQGAYSTPELFLLAGGAAAGTFTFLTTNSTIEANNESTSTASYAAGDNYCVVSLAYLQAGQSLYLACLGTYSNSTTAVEQRGFLSSVEIVPTGIPATIATQPPTNTTVPQGMFSVNISASEQGTPPLSSQWLFNGANLTNSASIAGATNSTTLTLSNVTLAMAGNYSLFVSNAFGYSTSSNSVLTVTPVLRTGELTNLWTLLPGAAPYVTTGSTERGMTYDAFTTNLILVSRALGENDSNLVVLDPLSGELQNYMQVTGVPADVAGTSLGLSMVGVAADGAVYVGSLTVAASSTSYYLYRWADDTTNSTPTVVFEGDPASSVQANLRWGDNLAVRGAGTNTQILLAPASGTNVVMLQTADGMNFQTEIAPVVIAVSGVPSGFAELGLAFGPGTNTFWAKSYNNDLYLVQFNLNAATGAVVATCSLPTTIGVIGANNTLNMVAGLSIATDDNVELFNVANLTASPPLLDEELFPDKNGNGPVGGTGAITFGQIGTNNWVFALDTENGIMAFQINTNVAVPAEVTTQPASQTLLEGASEVTFTAGYSGTSPVYLQWRFDGTNIVGATNYSLTISNLTASTAGNYSLFVSNAFGTGLSSNALLTLVAITNTAQTTNIWNLLPGSVWFLSSSGTYERGLACDPVTSNLLVVSRDSNDNVVVLSPQTGAEQYLLNVSGVSADVPGSSLGISAVGVAADGMVYAGSVTVDASSTSYYLYQWADDTTNSSPTVVFEGDPASSVDPGLRWGDNLAVRGAGTNTQILLAPNEGTNVVLLQTLSDDNFQTEVAPVVIAVSGVPSGFAQLGLAFGPGTNTFWAKTPGSDLYLIQFDTNAATGTVLFDFPSNYVDSTLRGISTDSQQKWLAGVGFNTPDNVQLYDISSLSTGPVLRDEKLFESFNSNTQQGGTAATAFDGNYVFALNSDNGIVALLINTNYVVPLSGTFSITNITAQAGTVVLTWPSVAGHTYQVQASTQLSGGWSSLGSALTATGTTLSYTNSVSGAAKFFRVVGH
jgi:hypothetical protein